MKLFTVSGVVGLAGLVAILSGFRLMAQDVTITDPAWHDPENAPADTLPAFNVPVTFSYPASLAESDQSGYVLVRVTIGDKGERKGMARHGSQQAFAEATKVLGGMKYVPAKEGGKAVPVKAWYAVIFNPKTASADAATASARLLAVAPVTVEKEALGDAKLPLMAEAKVSLDEAGRVAKVVFEKAEMERFRPEVMVSLQRWRFAAARKEGVAVASEIAVPFMIWGPEAPEPKERVFPKAIKQARPRYPFEMKKRNIEGEVLVSFVVDEKGIVRDVKAVRSSDRAFEEAAVECVEGWKYSPGLEDGKPVETRMQQSIRFNMRNR